MLYPLKENEEVVYNSLVELPDRLRKQSNNVESEGFLTAAWLIRMAADEIEIHRKNLNV
ncbi:hypothetical protein [Caulobacter phage Cr30]|uniref:hypothetical protein n=1 Tax=Caulobacter phage Cr30 TaxID=1357714 RepID=UPI0004A9B647|nr:hypothetical protein OZ74_gp075 [Caulobacter phage Cr30]AGS80960.1 hypothetical protein [Caulobacter phage Cr30]